jgi:hypothetical protein
MNNFNNECIEIDITLRCNLACPNCDRMAPKNIDLLLKHFKKFVALKRHWKKIVLIGGEPLLHPQFKKILKIIERYKYNALIGLATNGLNNEKQLAALPPWVTVINSFKTSSKQLFKTFNVAPVDVGITTGFENGCYIAKFCGICLSVDGLYYPCAPGATVAREFKLNIGQKTPDEVNASSFKQLCKYCGHFKYDKKYNSRKEYEDELTTTQQFSKSWLER